MLHSEVSSNLEYHFTLDGLKGGGVAGQCDDSAQFCFVSLFYSLLKQKKF